jgi:ribonuclease HI
VLVSSDGIQLEFSGVAASTTNNRMEITAAIEALRRSPSGLDIIVCTDSQYLVKTMSLGWKRRENLDLWKMLDTEVAQRKVRWEWIRGHSGNPFNERADQLARNAALGKPQNPALDSLTQINTTPVDDGRAQGARERGFWPQPRLPPGPLALSNEETAEAQNEAEIVRLLRPLLAVDETLRRCAGCHRAFVATDHAPRMRAYCSLAACQLRRRRSSSS